MIDLLGWAALGVWIAIGVPYGVKTYREQRDIGKDFRGAIVPAIRDGIFAPVKLIISILKSLY